MFEKVAKSSKGSKPGERRGGRKKGAPNKKTAALVRAVEDSGITPLEYMLGVMRAPPGNPDMRFEAAKAAAPYIHSKLAAIEHTGKDGGPIEQHTVTAVEWVIVEAGKRG